MAGPRGARAGTRDDRALRARARRVAGAAHQERSQAGRAAAHNTTVAAQVAAHLQGHALARLARARGAAPPRGAARGAGHVPAPDAVHDVDQDRAPLRRNRLEASPPAARRLLQPHEVPLRQVPLRRPDELELRSRDAWSAARLLPVGRGDGAGVHPGLLRLRGRGAALRGAHRLVGLLAHRATRRGLRGRALPHARGCRP
mmetsp:Transcript_15749/g.40136  ORF Transcript_15749/g.40136 Transcript_15749/m.40136 type:complete len:201 (-) Transcript_15749:249-851(-)